MEVEAVHFNGERACMEAPIRVRSAEGHVILQGTGRNRSCGVRARRAAHAMVLHNLACKIGERVLQAFSRAKAGQDEAAMTRLRDFIDMRLDAMSCAEALSDLSARRRTRGRGVH